MCSNTSRSLPTIRSCSIPGIILTLHTAWRTDGAYVGITRQVVQSVAAFCKGEDFNVVV